MPTLSSAELDHQLGLKFYITSTRPIGGRIRVRLEDFIVEEISVDGLRANFSINTSSDIKGEYLWFILEKRGIDMISAIMELSKALRIPFNHFYFAGIKDAKAITRQFVSTYPSYETLLKEFKHNQIKLYGFFRRPFKLSPGMLYGNWFQIKISDIEVKNEKEAKRIVEKALHEIRTQGGVPAYYGYQRFGTIRPVTHIVGKYIIRGDFEAAVWEYVARPFPLEKNYEARREAWNSRDPKVILKIYPSKLCHERAIASYLVKHPNDYVGALRRLPLTLRRMFVQAYQSYLFNLLLSKRIERGLSLKFPEIGDYVALLTPIGSFSSIIKVSQTNFKDLLQLIKNNKAILVGNLFGFNTRLCDGIPGEIEREVLEEEGIKLENFRVESLPEVSNKGGYRHLSFTVENLKLSNISSKSITVQFILRKGNYATVFLRELMKPRDIVRAGF